MEESISKMPKMEKALFAAGCFWGIEEAFRKVSGVIDVRAGYSGGTTDAPTYENVCSGNTGHAEVVEVIFNPEEVSYKELLNVFWDAHDPAKVEGQKEGQGPDIGNQYRSAIFYLNDAQKEIAEDSFKELELSKKYTQGITTEITQASEFFKAEEYHQQYLAKKK